MRKTFEECREEFMRAHQARNWNDIASWATEVLKYDDTLASVWANRGEALGMLGFPLDAILNYDRALALTNDKEQEAILYTNKGAAYWDMFNAEKALKCLGRAIDLSPLAQPYVTMGNIQRHQGQLQKAIGSFRQAVALNPDYADAHLVLSMALLRTGALQEGWREYAWRWKTSQLPPRNLKAPMWEGEDLTDKKLLLYGEQGLGDIMQFARYARVLVDKFPHVEIIVEGRQPVKRLLKSIPEIASVINIGDPVPKTDYAISMIDLAARLTPSVSSIPSSKREFYIEHSDVANWTRRMDPLFSRMPKAFKVGICWAGMARDSHPHALAVDQVRSATLNDFAPLAKIPNIAWVSLQKGPPAEQIKKPPAGMTIGDFTEDMYDFYETCAAIENLDLVISVDTAVLHAAASLGKPTWLLSRWDGCWRWFGNGTLSPWYPSLRQFTQDSFQEWDGMMLKVAAALEDHVRHKAGKESNLTLAK